MHWSDYIVKNETYGIKEITEIRKRVSTSMQMPISTISVTRKDREMKIITESIGQQEHGSLQERRLFDFTLDEIKQAAGDDWNDIKGNKEILSVFASALRDGMKRRMGVIPEHYTQDMHCLNCGDVKLWEGCPEIVQGCPWCFVNKQQNIIRR